MLLFVGMQVFGALPRAVAADPETGTITGTVLDAAGHPLVGATVTSSGVPAVTATTTAAGSYTLVVPVGPSTLTATATGYVARTSAAVDVALNATISDINFTLPKYATATGIVTDASAVGIGDVDVKFYDATSSSSVPVLTTTTAPNGTYLASALPPGSYKVQYDAARVPFMTRWHDLATTRDLATIVPFADGANLELSTTLVTAATIQGTITDLGSGAAISGAEVVAFRSGVGIATVRTGTDGSYRLKIAEAGQYTLAAYASDHVTTWLGGAEHQASASSIALVNSETRTGVDIAMNTGGAISGTMTPGNVAFSYVTAALLGDSYYASVNTADGTYTIRNLPPGAYTVGFRANGYVPLTYASTVSVVRNVTTPAINASLTPIGTGGGTGQCTLTGRVTNLDGLGLGGALVASGQESTTTLADGTYALTVTAFANVSFSLEGYVSSTTYTSCSQPVMPGDSALSRIVVITGKVTVDGVPRSGAVVVAHGITHPYASTTTDATGTYTFTNLAEDNYAISAAWVSGDSVLYPTQFYGGGSNLADASYLPAPEGSTLTGITIDLGKAGSVNGTVFMADGSLATGARVSVTGTGINTTQLVETNGRYSIGGLPAGTYLVSAYLHEWATTTRTFSVSLGGTADNLDLTLGDGFTVQGIASRGSNLANHTVYLARGTQLEATTTDASGHYVFRGVPAGTYAIGVELGSGSIFWVGGTYDRLHATPLTVAGDSVQDVVVPAVSTVDVAVKDAGGATLTDAAGFVIVKDRYGIFVTQQQLTAGHVSLPLWLGDFTFETQIAGYPGATAAVTIDQAPTDTATVTQPVGGSLTIQLDEASTAAAVRVVARDVATGLTAVGGVPMEGLAAGIYKVAYYPLDATGAVCGPLVWYGGTGFVSSDPIDVNENGATVLMLQADCAVVPTGYDLTVHLQVPAGVVVSPTDPIQVFLTDQAGQSNAWQPVNADATGTATFTGVQPGTYVVDADGSSYGLLSPPVTVVVTNASPTVDVPMVLGGQVTGRVVDGFSHLVRASVTLVSATHSYQRDTATGLFALDGLEPGDYTLTVTPAAPYSPVTVAHVPVVAGQTLDVGTITTALGGRITGHLPSLAQGYSVTIDALNAAGAVVATTQGILGNDYALWGVPTGTVRVRFSGDALVTQWWNSATTFAAATPIPVVAGGVVTGISPALENIVVPTTTITGHVTGVVGSVTGITVAAVSNGVQVATVDVAADGSYTLTVPLNGTYTVSATQCIAIPIGEFVQCIDRLASDSRTVAVQTTPVSGIDLSFGGGLLAFTAPLPTIDGTVVVGQTLTATPGTWSPVPDTTTYQWFADGVAIASATGQTLVLDPTLIGAHLTVQVTGTKTGYATLARTSAPTAVVAAAPVVAGVVTFSGTPVVGTPVTVDPGTWSPVGTTLSYAWTRDGVALLTATENSYTPTAEDLGKGLTVTVVGTKDGQTTSVTVTSELVLPGTLVPGTVSITGDATVGSTLTAITTPWGPDPVTVGFQWLRNGSPILGATSATYVVGGADVTATLSVVATGTKPGYGDAPVTSAPVTVGLLTMPTATLTVPSSATVGQTITPTVTGWPAGTTVVLHWLRGGVEFTTGASYQVAPADAGSILTVTATGTKVGYNDGLAFATLGTVQPGAITGTVAVTGTGVVGTTVSAAATWTPSLVPAATYTWQRNGVAVGTGALYVVDGADLGATLTVTATPAASVLGYTVTPATASVVVAPGTIAGTVSILGTPAVGQTLTASGSWTPGGATVVYMWLRDGVPVGPGTTYTPTVADAGHLISVQARVAATGYTTLTRDSSAVAIPLVAGTVTLPTATVGAAVAPTLAGWPDVTPTITWSIDGGAPVTGTTYTPPPTDSGRTLTVTVTVAKAGFGSASATATTVVQDATMAAGSVALTPLPTVGISSAAVLSGWAAGSTYAYSWLVDGTEVATTASYTPNASDAGKQLTLTVTATKVGYGTASASTSASVANGAITGGAATITGTLAVGSTLTASSTGWTPTPATVTYAWSRDGVPTGVTGDTYALTMADIGHAITVSATASAPGYGSRTVTSAPTAQVPPVAMVPGQVTITGTAAVGSTLTAASTGWTPSDATVTFQWLRNGAPISGATATTYVPTLSDVGATISVRGTASAPGYVTTSVTSAPTAAVPAVALTPGTVTIAGTPAVGSTLTANPGTWSPAGATFTYVWLRGGAPISGATSSTYVVGLADVGAAISVTVTGSLAGFTPTSATSAPTAVVPQPSVVAGTVTISGSPYALSTLTANPGTWSPANVRLSYQWLRDGVPIAGATGQTYAIPFADIGHTLSVSVTGSRVGLGSATAVSAPTPAIQQQRIVAGTVTITGTPMVASTLTAQPGTWTPATVRLSYQWFRDGVAIPGATDPTYTLVTADLGHRLTVSVLGTRFGYVPASATSAPTAPVQAAHVIAGTVTITGTAAAGNRLRANAGTWTPTNVTLTYQWLRDGAPIAGATGTRYTVTPTDAGHTLAVTVTGTRTGFTPATATSAPTAVVPPAQVAAGTVAIQGRPVQGSFLIAQTGGWSQNVSISYQWLRDGVAVPAARRWYYQVTSQDAGHVLTVTVTGTQPGYLPASVTSAGVVAR